ncbi:class A beta-lactamase [Parashewanella hymeniacidonis]|uniref:class A beta-lactamase n=1 Tax=Parashewanella hymeniacidonis TaxID=2807618 RepID=UPI003B84B27F
MLKASSAAVVFLLSLQVNAAELKPRLSEQFKQIETEIAGRLGVAILDSSNGTTWSYRGDERFPLMSTFKVLACAKMFSDIEAGQLNKSETTIIKSDDLITWSPITKKLINKQITVFDACKATMLTSDNTAANIVLEHIGGSSSLTKYLRKLGDPVTRLDRTEPDLNSASPGDVRDTSTPNAMVNTVNKLLYSRTLSLASRQYLSTWMQKNRLSTALLRSTLPADWHIADRTGAGNNGSRGIVASIWKGDRSPLIISIYLTETNLSLKDRNKAVASIGRVIFDAYNVR